MINSQWSNEAYSDGASPSSEGLLRLRPKFNPREDMGGVMFVHGAGSGATYCMDAYGRQGILTQRIISEGYSGISGDNGGPQTWGNPTSVRRIESNLSELFGMGNVEAGKYALVSGSMGGLNSFNYAAQAAVKPSAIVTVIPVINLEDIRANNRGGYGSLINAAYSGGYNESTMGQFFNPYTMRNADKLKGIPTLIFYGASDTLCLPTYATQFVAADPTYRQAVSLPYGHQEEAYAAVDHDMVIAFLEEHLS